MDRQNHQSKALEKAKKGSNNSCQKKILDMVGPHSLPPGRTEKHHKISPKSESTDAKKERKASDYFAQNLEGRNEESGEVKGSVKKKQHKILSLAQLTIIIFI